MREHRAAFLLIILASSLGSTAQTATKDISDSGNRFLEVCASTEKPPAEMNDNDFVNAGLCQGFMLGLGSGIGIATAAAHQLNPNLDLKGTAEDIGICLPDEVELGQLTRVTLKYIRDHPEQAHLRSATLVTMAEINAFPCAKPAQKP
jgi:hypothetical protein